MTRSMAYCSVNYGRDSSPPVIPIIFLDSQASVALELHLLGMRVLGEDETLTHARVDLDFVTSVV